MTIKFLKPMKLGVVVESWLKQDVRGSEWTAATCLYFFCCLMLRGSPVGSLVVLGPLVWE
jgi:hypothetical protein